MCVVLHCVLFILIFGGVIGTVIIVYMPYFVQFAYRLIRFHFASVCVVVAFYTSLMVNYRNFGSAILMKAVATGIGICDDISICVTA